MRILSVRRIQNAYDTLRGGNIKLIWAFTSLLLVSRAGCFQPPMMFRSKVKQLIFNQRTIRRSRTGGS